MTFSEIFRRYGTTVFSENPSVAHAWSVQSDGCKLIIPAQSDNGFAIEVDVGLEDATIYWGDGHTHFPMTDDIEMQVENMFGLIRDMLSPDMRVRQSCAGGKPYWNRLESYDGTKWAVEDSGGPLFWNYFAKRTLKTYSNAVLPGRMSRAQSAVASDGKRT